MTSIKDQKTALVAIAALAGVLAVSTVAVHNAFADDSKTITITKSTTNTGVNVQTDTDQKQNCETAGGNSPMSASCQATSTDTLTQSGGVLKK
jgi:hypothetical protein